MDKKAPDKAGAFFDGCAWRRTLPNGQKSLIRPGSEKDTAKSKGVHCEVVSEGR